MPSGLRSALFLTLSRILLGPLFLLLYLYYPAFGLNEGALPFVLLAILVVSELSDVLDGVIARRTNQVTELGKLLDPMADTIFRLSVFFAFTQGTLALPISIVIIFFYRECLISVLRTLCALRGIALGARLSGKIKAILQAIASFVIVFLMILFNEKRISEEAFYSGSYIAVVITASYSVLSAIEYIFANRVYFKRSLRL